MKQLACFLLLISVLFSGCSAVGEPTKETATFYYLCSEYETQMCCVIASEEREVTGHLNNLSYLLALYLMGPADDGYRLPLHSDTHIMDIQRQDGQLQILLSDTEQSLSDVEFSLACACLTQTCLEITDAEAVTITTGSRSATMTQDSLTLYDNIAQTAATEETQ